MLKLQDQFPVEPRLHRFILCTRRSVGTAHEGGGAISQLDLPSLTPSSVADMWSTATRSSSFGYFSKLLQVVDN